jgi:transcriptional regulator with XRE-family HTH domain
LKGEHFMTREEWKHIFGDNLDSLIRERGMSQRQLAIDSGVSQAMISDYINKRLMPGVQAVVNIAYALDVDVSELIDFDERIDW